LLRTGVDTGEIEASIECPDFLQCVPPTVRVRFNSALMQWDWKIVARDATRTREGPVEVKFFGVPEAGSASGPEPSGAVPPLNVTLRVDCGMTCWGDWLDKGTALLDKFKGFLLALGALGAIVAGWVGWWRKKDAA
jgi:hypothetical protein